MRQQGRDFPAGIAPGYQAVASIMERLECLPELEDVRCIFTAETGNKERLSVQFWKLKL